MSIEQTIERFRGKGIFLDAQLLLVWIVGRIDPSEIGGKFRRTREYVPDDFYVLELVLERFSTIYTTPHILSEVSNLGGSVDNKKFGEFFREFSDTVEVLKEKVFQSKHLCRDVDVRRFGLPDVSVLRAVRKRVLLLTDDFPLYSRAVSLRLPAINFNHIRQDYLA